MVRLAKYQIVDDIFKKVTYLPDGKNHGLNVLLDWSGSITDECADLIEQSMILAEFCRKVNIPHRVYLFTDSYDHEYGRDTNPKLIELFSDKMSARDYKKNHINLSHIWNNYYIGRARNYAKTLVKFNSWFEGCTSIDDENGYRWYEFDTSSTHNKYRLGGTPLDHAITAMRCLLPEFNSEYNIEKSILTVITDGYSHSSSVFEEQEQEHKDKAEQCDGIDVWRQHVKRFIIDPFSNKSYPYSDNEGGRYNIHFQQTQNLLDWVSQETGCIVTGYFCLAKKQDLWGLYDCLKRDVTLDIDTTWREIRKEGLAVRVHGYNKLFLTSSNALSVEGDDELSEDLQGATKRKLLGAFKKNQRSKTTSRFLTNEFIKEIA